MCVHVMDHALRKASLVCVVVHQLCVCCMPDSAEAHVLACHLLLCLDVICLHAMCGTGISQGPRRIVDPDAREARPAVAAVAAAGGVTDSTDLSNDKAALAGIYLSTYLTVSAPYACLRVSTRVSTYLTVSAPVRTFRHA